MIRNEREEWRWLWWRSRWRGNTFEKSTFSQVPCPPLVLGSAQAGFWRRILDDKAPFWQVFSWGGCCNTAQIVIHELFGGSNTKGEEVDWGFVTFCLNWKFARILSLLEPEHLMIEAVTCNHGAILKLESVFFQFWVLSVEDVNEWTFMAISVASGSSSWSRTLFLREARLVFSVSKLMFSEIRLVGTWVSCPCAWRDHQRSQNSKIFGRALSKRVTLDSKNCSCQTWGLVFQLLEAVPYKWFAFFKRCEDNTRGEADGRCLERDVFGL